MKLTVPPEAAGERLDRFVARVTGESRHRVMEAIEDGRVRVAGRRAKKGQPVEAGQEISVELPPPPGPPSPQPELPLSVVHEDPGFVIVNKPAGWPSHPLEHGETGTLANALVARYPACAGAGADPREAGLAHRLDTGTSGLLVAARSREVWNTLRAQFAARTVHKEYLALVAGQVFGPSEIDVPLEHEAGGRVRAAPDGIVERGGAREALTRVEVEDRAAGWTLVRCTITTGVMHQIRVHLAHAGTPVAGDDAYGGARPAGLHRMFLHAAVLGFTHPVSGAKVRYEAPLPDELEKIRAELFG